MIHYKSFWRISKISTIHPLGTMTVDKNGVVQLAESFCVSNDALTKNNLPRTVLAGNL